MPGRAAVPGNRRPARANLRAIKDIFPIYGFNRGVEYAYRPGVSLNKKPAPAQQRRDEQ